MCRKQPTPTDILENPNLTELDKLVFLYIRPRVRNSDWVYSFEQAGKQHKVELKRGQCIVKVASLAELLQRDRKTIHKSLESLSKWYSQTDNKGMPYWCLITRLYYDDLISMDNQKDNRGTIEGQWKDNGGTANKSDKKEKNEKEVWSPKFEEFRMQFPHARKWKKQEAMKQYSALVEQEVRRELDLLKLRIDIWEVDPKYLSACERRLRDFTPISKTIRTKSISLYRKLHKEDPKKEELYKRWIDNYPEQRKAGSEEFRKSQGINLSSFK